ncbi:hypothetical protein Tco_1175770 [Tanacetum coccineum]
MMSPLYSCRQVDFSIIDGKLVEQGFVRVTLPSLMRLGVSNILVVVVDSLAAYSTCGIDGCGEYNLYGDRGMVSMKLINIHILKQTSKMAEQDTPPPTITTMKIPIIKKGEYDIWSMRMRQYICHTDHNLWDIIVNGDLQEEHTPTGDQSGPSAPPAPKTAKQLAAKRNQERFKSILLLAILDEYLLKFHNVPDSKSL